MTIDYRTHSGYSPTRIRCTQAAPSTREPFFPAAFRHAAVVVVADEDAGFTAEEVANQVIQVQTEHHTALTTAAAEHKAAVAAALSAGQPAPPNNTTDDTAAAPSVFTKLGYTTTPHRHTAYPASVRLHAVLHCFRTDDSCVPAARVSASFRFTDYAQAKSTVLGFAGSSRDVVGAGKAIKEAHESSTEDGKPADVNEWTLSPRLKALVLLGWIEDERSKLVRVRRLRHCCPCREDEPRVKGKPTTHVARAVVLLGITVAPPHARSSHDVSPRARALRRKRTAALLLRQRQRLWWRRPMQLSQRLKRLWPRPRRMRPSRPFPPM